MGDASSMVFDLGGLQRDVPSRRILQ